MQRGALHRAVSLGLLSVLVSPNGPARADPIDGVAFDIVYTGEVLTNLTGGVSTGTRYLDNLDVTLEVDTQEAAGFAGGTLFLYGLYNNDNSLTDEIVGDAQVVSNIDTINAWRLYEAWYEHAFLTGRLTAKVGLYDLNSEFDVNETGSLFVNSSHGIGAEFAQSGLNGPSIFPVTSLAGRIQWRVAEMFTLRGAVLEATPGDPDRPRRTTIDFDDNEGVLSVLEGEWAGENAARAILGYWRYSAEFETVSTGSLERGNDGVYGLVEGPLWSSGEAGPEVRGFLRAGVADEEINQLSHYIGSGLVLDGFVPGRDDQIGLAVAFARNGDPFRRAASRDGSPVTRAETNIELTYRAQITEWLALQPNFQYIFDPGTDPTLDSAFVAGVRFEVAPLNFPSSLR